MECAGLLSFQSLRAMLQSTAFFLWSACAKPKAHVTFESVCVSAQIMLDRIPLNEVTGVVRGDNELCKLFPSTNADGCLISREEFEQVGPASARAAPFRIRRLLVPCDLTDALPG